MSIEFNAFQKSEVEGVARILKVLGAGHKLVAVMSPRLRGYYQGKDVYQFRVFLGTANDLSFKTQGNTSTGMSKAEKLVEVLGEDSSTLLTLCGCLIPAGAKHSLHKNGDGSDSRIWES